MDTSESLLKELRDKVDYYQSEYQRAIANDMRYREEYYLGARHAAQVAIEILEKHMVDVTA